MSSDEQAKATGAVAANAFGAMMKIFLVSVVGVLCAKYPRGNPLLPVPVLKNVARFCNAVLVPCLILGNLGASLSWGLLTRVGIMVPLSILNNMISLGAARLLKPLHENDELLYKASVLTVASPNTISMPLMVLQSLCDDNAVAADYSGDSAKCFRESTALMFIYSIGFHIMFWGYVFPSFEDLQKEYCAREDGVPLMQQGLATANSDDSNVPSVKMSYSEIYQRVVTLVNHVAISPSMLGIYGGLFIGLIPPVQRFFFSPDGLLYPIGSAVQTLASPVVALNIIIMAASLAHIDVDFRESCPEMYVFLIRMGILAKVVGSPTPSIELAEGEIVRNPVLGDQPIGQGDHRRRSVSSSAYNPMLNSDSPGDTHDSEADEHRRRNNSVDRSKHADLVIGGALTEGPEPANIGIIKLDDIKQKGALPQPRTTGFLILCRYSLLVL